MKHFKGFIITKNKSPIAGETFKNKSAEQLRSYEEVKNMSDYAGIIEDGYIIVDVDDEKQSNVLLSITKKLKLNTLIYKTTRGMHFYFKVNEHTITNKTNAFTSCGLRVDMKLGSRNSYVCLKHEGVEREIIYHPPEGTIEVLPIWLTPIRYTFPFLSMENGDGRNQSLFNYILILQSNGYDKAEARETITIINDFVLEDKLPDNELNTILRDDAFEKPIFYGGEKGTTFLFDKFAKYMVSEHNIIKINGQLHVYIDGIYAPDVARIEAQMIRHIPSLSHAQRTEVMRYINILIWENTMPSPAHLIAFRNGVYDLEQDNFIGFSDDFILTNKIDWDYNPSAYNKLADDTLNKIACNDPEIRSLMDEALGYTFYRRNELRKCFILTGKKANGKSTYLTMIQNLLGRQNYSSLDLGELGERFKTTMLFGKLANIGDDVNDSFIKDLSVFKKLVSGDTVNVEKKGEEPFDFENYSKLMFSANTIPRMKDQTGAVIDRIITVPFNATFRNTDLDFDPFIRYKLETPEVMSYLINIGLEGLKRVISTNQFTKSVKAEENLAEYELSNNPILQFIDEHDEDIILNQSTQNAYITYIGFCNSNGLQPIGRLKFTSAICDELNIVSKQQRIDGKRLQVFVRE